MYIFSVIVIIKKKKRIYQGGVVGDINNSILDSV